MASYIYVYIYLCKYLIFTVIIFDCITSCLFSIKPLTSAALTSSFSCILLFLAQRLFAPFSSPPPFDSPPSLSLSPLSIFSPIFPLLVVFRPSLPVLRSRWWKKWVWKGRENQRRRRRRLKGRGGEGGDPIRGADSSSLHVARKIKLRPREGNVNAERPDPQSEGSPVISLKHR